MIEIYERARSIHAKLIRDGEPRAVIKIGESFRTFKVDAIVDGMRERDFRRIVGIYDGNCPIEWLEADLEWAALHLP